jgi:hypothetical protein
VAETLQSTFAGAGFARNARPLELTLITSVWGTYRALETDPIRERGGPMKREISGLCLFAVAALFGVDCGGNTHSPDQSGGSQPSDSDAGAQPSPGSDAGASSSAAGACSFPSVPEDLCAALPTGKVSACSQDSSGQPSQTGYLEIDSPGSSPMYVCATSWTPDPSGGYIFGQPGTFMSQSQSCCGGTVSATAAPTAPQPSIGSLGTLHIPSHIKPQETEQPGSGPIRQNPFAVTITDTKSGAGAAAAMSNWISWAGDGKPHPGSDGTGAYYFPSGLLINYVILETSEGLPVLVIGPEVSLAADGTTPIGHPTLGVCSAGGGAPLAVTAGEVQGTTLNNHSGRYDYGPSATAQTLDTAAKLFNCFGIQITATKYYAPN